MPKHDIILIIIAITLCACATSPKETEKPPVKASTALAEAVEPPRNASRQTDTPAREIEYIYPYPDVQPIELSPKTYPKLIYGAPKPLVCSREYVAKGPLVERPNLQVMWEHYLYERPERVWEEVGGAVHYNGCLPEDKGGWRNACTVRLSHMLNKAGHKIPHIKGQTVSGGSGEQYFFRLNDAQAYIFKSLGDPDISLKMSGRFFELPSDPGLFIIKFAGSSFTGHTTIWNGAGTVDGVDIAGYEIFFWKLPCFIPPERKQKTMT